MQSGLYTLSMRSFANFGELTIITGLDPNQSMHIWAYLRAILRSSWSGLFFSALNEKMFPRIGKGWGPSGYCAASFPVLNAYFGAIMARPTVINKLPHSTNVRAEILIWFMMASILSECLDG